jgi:hypothetical protein
VIGRDQAVERHHLDCRLLGSGLSQHGGSESKTPSLRQGFVSSLKGPTGPFFITLPTDKSRFPEKICGILHVGE